MIHRLAMAVLWAADALSLVPVNRAGGGLFGGGCRFGSDGFEGGDVRR